jgi:hypothetical protein
MDMLYNTRFLQRGGKLKVSEGGIKTWKPSVQFISTDVATCSTKIQTYKKLRKCTS